MDIALQILTTVSTFIFVASLKSTVLLVLLILVLATLGRLLSVNSRYLLWSVLLVSLVTPIGFKLSIPGIAPLEPEEALATTGLDAADWSLEDAPARVAAAVNSSPVQSENAVVSSTAVNATGLLPWRELLSLFWLGGVLVVLGAMMVVSRRFERLAARAMPPPAQLEKQFLSCKQQADCGTSLRLAVSRELTSPMVCGALRPVLLWPENLELQLEAEQVRCIFLHELMHVKRQDLLSAAVVALIQALHWFNPAIWLAFARLRQDRELACDASTLELLGEKQMPAYAHTLIHLAASMPQKPARLHGIGILEDHSLLNRRIRMLVSAPGKNQGQSALAGSLLILFSVLAFGQPERELQDAENLTLAAQVQRQEAAASPVVQVPEAQVASEPVVIVTETIPASPPASTPVVTELQETIDESDDLPAAISTSSAEDDQEMNIPSVLPEVELPEAAFPEPHLMLAAAEQLDTDAAPQREDVAMEEEEMICIQLQVNESDSARICDTPAQWSIFENRTGLEPGSIYRTAAVAQPGDLFAIDSTECRKERLSWYKSTRVCRGASEWASIDARRAENRALGELRALQSWNEQPGRWMVDSPTFQPYVPATE